jgi:hypothetical protein
MSQLPRSTFGVIVHTALLFAPAVLCAQVSLPGRAAPTVQADRTGSAWTSDKAEYIYGLPEVKPHRMGTLTLSADDLTFTGKEGSTSIPRSTITAVSAGDQRVELWGITGKLMRMAIPDGGGLAIAAFAHHRVDMLTVDFNDTRGGAHAAVFFLGAKTADAALQSFALAPKSTRTPLAPDCGTGLTEPGSMLILTPDWNGAKVPAVYQGLVYEHVTERFKKAKNVTRVYREGETMPVGSCPQYAVHLSVTGFREGNSVERAALGPIGMFVGTTQFVFKAQLTDRTGQLAIDDELKTTIRGDGESTDVADHIAKSLEKKYEKAVKAAAKKAHGTPEAAKA